MARVCVESAAASPRVPRHGSNKAKAIRWLQDHGYVIPRDKDGQVRLAGVVCDEVVDMFPSLVRNLFSDDEQPAGDREEFFIFSDMRDSSDKPEQRRAEAAKADFVAKLRKAREQDPTVHFNEDLNDEKTLYAPKSALARSLVSALIRCYAAHDKYGRIGVVSSLDTLERATKREGLPSSPANYAIAKRIGEFLKGNADSVSGHVLGDLDKRRSQQRYGVLSLSAGARTVLLAEAELLGSGRQFESVSGFLVSTEDGWVHVLDGSVPIDAPESPKLQFSVFLYR